MSRSINAVATAIALGAASGAASAQFDYVGIEGREGPWLFVTNSVRAQTEPVADPVGERELIEPPFATVDDAVQAIFLGDAGGPIRSEGASVLDVAAFPEIDAVSTGYDLTTQTAPHRFELTWRTDTAAALNTPIPGWTGFWGPGADAELIVNARFGIRFTAPARVRISFRADASEPLTPSHSDSIITLETGLRPDSLTPPVIAGVGEDTVTLDAFAFEVDAEAGRVFDVALRSGMLTQNIGPFELGWERWQSGSLVVEIVGCGPADLATPFGVIDLSDINAFVDAFLANSAAADLNGDALTDLADINTFVASFTAGCP